MNTDLKRRIAFAMIMGVVTTGIISFTLISINLGFSEKFTGIWLKSWAIGYSAAIPAILLIGPRIQYIVDKIIKPQTR